MLIIIIEVKLGYFNTFGYDWITKYIEREGEKINSKYKIFKFKWFSEKYPKIDLKISNNPKF